MSDSTTIARPYAKAIFEYALANQQLKDWSAYLYVLSEAVALPDAASFIANPATSIKQHTELLMGLNPNKDSGFENIIHLLAQNKRILLLPEIFLLFEAYRAEQEKTLEIHVSSFSKLSAAQEVQMTDSLSKRLQRHVALNVTIDTTLLGGAIIRAGDLVIDGSVRGKLNKLGTGLAA